MRWHFCIFTIAGLLLLLDRSANAQLGREPATPPATQPAADVPVRAVVLFSSGVGYFEHYGSVDGSASTELRFKTQQINDILKSLVLEDLDGGHVAAVTYPSQNPLEKTLRSFQVDLSSNPSLGDLLNELRGAKVKVSLQGEEVEGTILGLEKKQKAVGKDGPPVEVWVLNLIDGATLRSLELDDVLKLQLEDPELQKELREALLALSQARDQDKKPVTIQFVGQGKRHVRLGYVVETPVWKTSYRLLLSADNAALKPADQKGTIQGWAIVENQTDNDWKDVELSLISGRPISFIEDLYQPLYVPRPVVQPQLYASLSPQTYEGGLAGEDRKAVSSLGVEEQERLADKAGDAAPALQMARAAGRSELSLRTNYRRELDSDALGRPMNAAASIASIASAAKMGELFQYTVGSVSLPRQRSAMIPILNDPVQLQRLSIYNQAVLARYPLNGVRLTNTTGKHLLQGPLTVFDTENYAGDASIDNVPPGQQRLLSYGVDLEVLMDATKNTTTSTIESGKIVKGVLWLSRRNLFSQDYVAENKGKTDKTLVIEHPVRQGWNLLDPKPIETTESVYRFEEKAAAGKLTQLTVREQVMQREEVAILPADVGQLAFYQKTGQIDPKVKDVLAHVIELKNAMTDTQRQLTENQQASSQITAEQARIRENMKTVNSTSQYYNRLLTKLNDQETELEKLQQGQEDLRKTLDSQRKELEAYLGNLNVG